MTADRARYLIAIHEAGHAACALRCGRFVTEVAIAANDDDSAGYAAHHYLASDEPDVDGAIIFAAGDAALMLAGGYRSLHERLRPGDPNLYRLALENRLPRDATAEQLGLNSRDDVAGILRIGAALSGQSPNSPRNANADVSRALSAALTMTAANWSLVLALAERLHWFGKVDMPEIYRLGRRHAGHTAWWKRFAAASGNHSLFTSALSGRWRLAA